MQLVQELDSCKHLIICTYAITTRLLCVTVITVTIVCIHYLFWPVFSLFSCVTSWRPITWMSRWRPLRSWETTSPTSPRWMLSKTRWQSTCLTSTPWEARAKPLPSPGYGLQPQTRTPWFSDRPSWLCFYRDGRVLNWWIATLLWHWCFCSQHYCIGGKASCKTIKKITEVCCCFLSVDL